MIKLLKPFATVSLTFLSLGFINLKSVQALTFVGSYNVADGPAWSTNPPVYSAKDAAALIFGGSPNDYVISTLGPDPNAVNNLAFYDGWGDTQYLTNPQSEDFKIDIGTPGYADPGGVGSSYSAYVNDHSFNAANANNFVFAVNNSSVPFEFSPLLGLLCIGGIIVSLKFRNVINE